MPDANDVNQIEFSSLLFDTLFGLILFFNIDLFLDIDDRVHFVFYLFSCVVLVHWWLTFKSADDAFGDEVTDSAADLVFGIIYLIFIDYFILLARKPDYVKATWFLVALLAIDLLWALVWRFVGRWQTRKKEKIVAMERVLGHQILIDVSTIILFCFLLLTAGSLAPVWFVAWFIAVYSIYLVFTFKAKIIDIRIF